MHSLLAYGVQKYVWIKFSIIQFLDTLILTPITQNPLMTPTRKKLVFIIQDIIFLTPRTMKIVQRTLVLQKQHICITIFHISVIITISHRYSILDYENTFFSSPLLFTNLNISSFLEPTIITLLFLIGFLIYLISLDKQIL